MANLQHIAILDEGVEDFGLSCVHTRIVAVAAVKGCQGFTGRCEAILGRPVRRGGVF